MARSVLLVDDEVEATVTIVADALVRLDPNIDTRGVIDDALTRLGEPEIPRKHALFHAFVSGALYDAFSDQVGTDTADTLMSDVSRMWRSVSLHQRDSQASPPPQDDELGGVTVLVVDDDGLARRALARALPEFGAVVHTATDTQTAMRITRSHRVDVIVADYDMPGGSGATLAGMIALSMGDHAPPVICLTGATITRNTGFFQAILSKPTHPSQLVAAITEALAADSHPD